MNTGNSIGKQELSVSVARVNAVLGITVPDEEILRILASLNMEPVLKDGELTLQVPAYREDIESYQDVAEEVIRLYGYEHLVPTFLKEAEVTGGGLSEIQQRELKLKETLCGAGIYECIHYSFFSPSDLKLLRFPEEAAEMQAIRIMNPISEEISLMRTTLTPSMLNAVMRNQKNGNLAGRLFEIAKAFLPKELPLKNYPDERDHLVLAFFGEGEDFYSLKGALDLTAEALGLSFGYESAEQPFLHPYQTAAVLCNGQRVGYIGKLAYDIAAELSLRTDVYVAELDLKTLYMQVHATPVFEPLPAFPEVTRDIALIMEKSISCAQVERVIHESCKYIREVRLFDVYEGAPIPPTKKSMAFTVTFRPKDEELKGEDIDRYVDKMLRKLKAEYDIVLRF